MLRKYEAVTVHRTAALVIMFVMLFSKVVNVSAMYNHNTTKEVYRLVNFEEVLQKATELDPVMDEWEDDTIVRTLYINYKAKVYDNMPKPVIVDNAYMFSEEDISLMAHMTFAEARGECEEGQLYVAHVILNRYRSRRWGNTIFDVLHARNQFSPIRDGSFARATPCDAIYDVVRRAIRNHMNGYDPTGGALFFQGLHVPISSWHTQELFVHGGHRFLR